MLQLAVELARIRSFCGQAPYHRFSAAQSVLSSVCHALLPL